MNILLVASEVTPFAKTGGLADVAGSLPRALARLGHDVRVVLPFYPEVRSNGFCPEESGLSFSVRLGSRNYRTKLRELDYCGVRTYFIEQTELFDRPGLYGYSSGDFPDNAERFGFFCRAVLQMLRGLHFAPDILHLNDWQTALLPLLLRTEHHDDPFFAATASIFTIHNLGYQGLFPPDCLQRLGLAQHLSACRGLDHHGQVSLLRAGILYADRINTVSPTYCREICTPEYGAGLDALLQSQKNVLSGIINGLDTDEWDPRYDPGLAASYSTEDLSGKALCKQALQVELNLERDRDKLLVGLVTRLDQQKGLDLLVRIWNKLVSRPLQLVLLGSGAPGISGQLQNCQRQSPGRTALRLGFDDSLARRIYAAADLFLMPSRYEPCGLGQLIALRYGAVPLVRATGGLADSIQDVDDAPGQGNGFSFGPADARALLTAMDRALACFSRPADWQKIICRGMRQDFSWSRSALAYLELYAQAKEDHLERRDAKTNQPA